MPDNATSQVQPAFAALAARAPSLALESAETRIARLQRLLKETMAARDAIYEAAHAELGLCNTDIDQQLLMVKGEIEYACKHLAEWMKPEPVKGSLMTLGKKSYIRYEPKGVVLTLGTWNAPYAIGLVPAVGALAAGNSVLLKPSELAPQSAAVLADIVARAMEPDVFTVLQGGPEVAQELLQQPFNHIFYIGGHQVGRLVMKAAAEHFASVTLEMGGKNPTIIDASADIEDTARKIAWGRLSNAGQVCIAPDYALVHESVKAAFCEALARNIQAMYNPDGAGYEASPEYPCIINDRHFERVAALLDDAREKGATFHCGGGRNPAARHIDPCVISDVDEGMRIMQEEIFGPAIAVVGWKDREEVIEIIKRRAKPLALYIYAKDREAIDWFLARTTAGSTVVNHNMIQSGTNPHLPFGGVNASGIGRIGGHFTFLECSNQRSIVEEGPPVGDPNMMYPPYSDKFKKMMGSMFDRPLAVPDAVVRGINGLIKVTSVFKRQR
ncbi:MAG: aldehyde dehydrogenase family protein [Algiphilus sp.]